MDRLEALADAVMQLNGWADPTSQAYQDRNPLLLRAYSLTRAQAQDERGVRVFTSLLGGYRAALNDLFEKCGGQSRAKLAQEAPLKHLLAVLGAGHPVAERRVLLFLRAALHLDERDVYAGTPLGWFLQTNADETAARGACAAAHGEQHA
ncbi:MAG TPA: hypothetical protein VNU44_14595 [Bryobacteraceae bacterium]|jgi:hypothetical protein|nr:hypothetical protein [Bryobacteraceae bacterium]